MAKPFSVHVNAVYSNVTVVTYDFYSYPFCSHKGKAKVDESLGEWFLGGRIRAAPFSFTFLEKEEYTKLCDKDVGKKGESSLSFTRGHFSSLSLSLWLTPLLVFLSSRVCFSLSLSLSVVCHPIPPLLRFLSTEECRGQAVQSSPDS